MAETVRPPTLQQCQTSRHKPPSSSERPTFQSGGIRTHSKHFPGGGGGWSMAKPLECGVFRRFRSTRGCWSVGYWSLGFGIWDFSMSDRLVIVDGIRTPFSKAGTELASLGADELGRIAVNALLTRTGLDPKLVDEVIFGCVAQPVDATNVARVIALRAGIPESVPAITVQRNCASGCEAITLANERLLAGRGSIFIVGGAESMSNIPLLFPSSAAAKFSRLGRAKSLLQRLQSLGRFRPSDFKPRVGLLLGLSDPVCGLNMGETAEVLAREYGITREEQDAFALESNRRAAAAREKLAQEICPAFLPSKSSAVTQDNGVRDNQSLDALAT